MERIQRDILRTTHPPEQAASNLTFTMPQKSATQPAYVNFQSTPVNVYDENRAPVSVLPWENRTRTSQGGRYVVRGEHYQQFVSGSGPLYPFPGDPSTLDSAEAQEAVREKHHANTLAQQEDAQLAALRGQIRLSATTTRSGQVLGETEAQFLARLRQELAARRIRTARDFDQASSAILLECPAITSDNIARLRESAGRIFPGSGLDPSKSISEQGQSKTVNTLLQGDPSESGAETDEVEDAPDLDDLTTKVGDFDPLEEAAALEAAPQGVNEDATEDSGPVNNYKRSDVSAMDMNGLREIVRAEGFEIPLSGKKSDLLSSVLDGLEQYGQLIED